MLLSGFITSFDLDGNVLKMAILIFIGIWLCTIYCLFAHLDVLNLKGMYWDKKKEGGEFWCQLPFKYNITVSSNYIL